jgi:hypothetical protein
MDGSSHPRGSVRPQPTLHGGPGGDLGGDCGAATRASNRRRAPTRYLMSLPRDWPLSPGPSGLRLVAKSESMGRLPPDGEGQKRMDPVTLIMTALAAGAASTLQDGTAEAIKGAYARLKALVQKRFAGRAKAELVSAAGADADADLVAAAQALMRLVDAAGQAAGKYQVVVQSSQGVQVGDHNTQHNTFGPASGH